MMPIDFFTIPFFFMFVVTMLLVFVIPGWVIFKKTGMPPALSLLCFVPGIGILICILILAFADWPIHQSRISQ